MSNRHTEWDGLTLSDKQLSIPGLPVPEPKGKPTTKDERIEALSGRLLRLELEVSLLQILVENSRT